MTLSAGKLRQRVDIQQPADAQDGTTGALSRTWSTFASNLPANIDSVNASEFIAAAAIQSGVTNKITIRWLAGVTAKMRVVDGDGMIYNILGVLPDSESGRESITLMTQRGINSG